MKNRFQTFFRFPVFIYFCFLIILAGFGCQQKSNQEEVSNQGQETYEATWESLKKHQLPEWFDDAKFGIFIHWGIYSVPAYNSEWYPRYMYTEGHDIYNYHTRTYGPPWEFGYKDFLPDFTAENWDPEKWARLFKEAGAKYVVPTAEHHDGFAMWDSKLTQWDAADKGPKRDIIGELGKAVRQEDMKYAPSYHRALNWQYYENAYNLPQETDTENPEYTGIDGLYPEPHEPGTTPSQDFIENWRKRWEEIQNNYQPDFAWFDFGWGDTVFHAHMQEMMANYYNIAQEEWNKEVAFNNKTIRNPPMAPKEVGDFIGLDHMVMDSIHARKWQCPTYMGGGSWAYNKVAPAEDFKSAEQLVDEFVDIVSKNGNLLLNVGPKADGTIPGYMQDRLRKIGKWLEVNEEAIFNTRPWETYGEGPSTQNLENQETIQYTSKDIRFTKSKDGVEIFALVMDWPENQTISIESMKNTEVRNVELLGHGKVAFENQSTGLTIQFPEQKPCNYAYSLRISLQQ